MDISTWPQRMGVKSGDTVQLMADLTRMAWNARKAGSSFTPEALLDAFSNALGETGDLLVPTFNFDLRDGDVFSTLRTRSISGALANAAIDHPGFRRTPHALHSFAVCGAHANELANRAERGSFGAASPFAFLHQQHGTLISIDLPLNDALTFAHFVEERVGVPYRTHAELIVRYTDANGSTSRRSFTAYVKRLGHHMDFTALEPLLEKAGALTRGEVDGSRFIRVDLAKTYDVIADDIRNNMARSIHQFRWSWWLRDVLKSGLRTFGIRTAKERQAHAARTP